MGMGHTVGHTTPSGLALTMIVLNSTATVRATIVAFETGTHDIKTPNQTDDAFHFNLLRHTTAQTGGTALVEKERDEDNIAASCTAVGGTMTEPTYEADELYNFAFNQKITFLWHARPDHGFKTTAGTANGIGLLSVITTMILEPAVDTTFSWDE